MLVHYKKLIQLLTSKDVAIHPIPLVSQALFVKLTGRVHLFRIFLSAINGSHLLTVRAHFTFLKMTRIKRIHTHSIPKETAGKELLWSMRIRFVSTTSSQAETMVMTQSKFDLRERIFQKTTLSSQNCLFTTPRQERQSIKLTFLLQTQEK